MTWWLIAAVVSAAVLALVCILAPEGWEDDAGFHFGREPSDAVPHTAEVTP